MISHQIRVWRCASPPQGDGRSRPKSVIERLLSHSRKQAFAVLLHRQDSAQGYRSVDGRRASEADVQAAGRVDCCGRVIDILHLISPPVTH
jgi:hypothetical protein